jgi:RNA polymerase sigma-32 factor
MKVSAASLSHAEARAIASKLGVKPEEVFEMETRLSGADIALDPAPGDEDSLTPGAYLADPDDGPAQLAEDTQTATMRSDGLRSAMSRLDSRSRRIIEARWLRDDDAATLQALADEYGVSAERIRQIESKALKTMRSRMASLQ